MLLRGRDDRGPQGRRFRNVKWVVLFGLPLPALALVSGLHFAFAVLLFAVVAAVWWGLAALLNRRRPISGPGPNRRVIATGAVALVLTAVLIQAVPYRAGGNPPVLAEPQWDSAVTRELAVKVCFDCHSNEVDYPWYAEIAPVSWAVRRHVDAGRGDLNFSEWTRSQREAHESAETVEEGSMPPWYYELTHPSLTSEEESLLIAGFLATFGSEEGDHEGDEERDEHDD